MNAIVIALIVLGLGATAYVLVRGIVTMARGKDISGEQSNRLMSYRVALQFATILLVVLLIVLVKSG
jgi:hypothetical protein